jgi:murein L,D-transpeptidase YcbB/YkuD
MSKNTAGSAAFSRRSVLLLGGGAALATVSPAAAQTPCNWADQIFKGAACQPASERRERQVETLNDLRPDSTPWRSDAMVEQIDNAIAQYAQIVQRGGWNAIPGTRMLRPGDDDERVGPLRRRLMASGDLRSRGGGYDTSFSFDDHVEAAVRRFQERHGLRVTGRVDQPTLAQLNISAQARLEQLRLNRRRVAELLQTRVEDRYVLVNAAAFQLEAVEGYEVRQRHRVIAGKPDRQTPIVRATIRALNFFPYWRVPDSVATLDLFPRLQKEPEYLQKEHIRVLANNFNGPEIDPTNIDWRTADAAKIKFRQDPGPHNALGLVRIDMPNSEGVYMHDTPLKTLFNQRGRSFSAGCVRVQDVFKLVEWIARQEQGWAEPGRAQAVIDSGQALDVVLTRPLPVYFSYITAWAEADGRIEFRPDVYGRDGAKDLAGERDPDAPPPPQSLAP